MAREGFVDKHVGNTALQRCHPESVHAARDTLNYADYQQQPPQTVPNAAATRRIETQKGRRHEAVQKSGRRDKVGE